MYGSIINSKYIVLWWMWYSLVFIGKLWEVHKRTAWINDSCEDSFDGDTLNALYIPNKNFWESANEIFNPRNSMMISRNDGTFNNNVNVMKDMIINSNIMIGLSRKYYTQDELNDIERIKAKFK